MNKKRRKTKYFTIYILLITASILILGFTNTIVSISNTNKSIKSEEVSLDKKVSSDKGEVSLDGFLFLGDSYTVLLQETVEKHHSNAIVLGQIGVQPSYWNENFNVLPNNDKVKGVVLLIGVNGVTFDDSIPNKEKLIDSLVKKYKNKNIYVERVFPVGKNFSNANPDTFNKAIKLHNKEIKNYCEKYDNVFFIDTSKDFITKDGYLKYTKDGLHIISDKQENFYNNIVNAINNINY